MEKAEQFISLAEAERLEAIAAKLIPAVTRAGAWSPEEIESAKACAEIQAALPSLIGRTKWAMELLERIHAGVPNTYPRAEAAEMIRAWKGRHQNTAQCL